MSIYATGTITGFLMSKCHGLDCMHVNLEAHEREVPRETGILLSVSGRR